MKQMNKTVYGASSRRYGTKLSVVPAIETSSGGRLHVHLLLELPRFLFDLSDDYIQLVTAEWKRLRWAEPECHVCYLGSRCDIWYWLKYIVKDSTNDFESLDLFNLYLGGRQRRSVHDQTELDKFLEMNKDAFKRNHEGWCHFDIREYARYLEMVQTGKLPKKFS